MAAFLADENIPTPMIARLRDAGFHVDAIIEIARGSDDADVLQRATRSDCVLITCDHDFGVLTIGQSVPVGGVVLLELAKLSLPSQIDRVVACFKAHANDFRGRLTIIEPTRLRHRGLPSATPE